MYPCWSWWCLLSSVGALTHTHHCTAISSTMLSTSYKNYRKLSKGIVCWQPECHSVMWCVTCGAWQSRDNVTMSQPDQCHSYLQLGSPESRGGWIISTHRLSAACCRFLLCSFSKHGEINSRLVHSPAAECAGDVESQKVWNLTLIFCRTHENNEVFKQRQRTKDSAYGETPKI